MWWQNEGIPNPGDEKAIRQGCACSAVTNNQGKGRPDNKWWLNVDCQIHCPSHYVRK